MEKLETFGMLTLNLRNTTMGEKKTYHAQAQSMPGRRAACSSSRGDIPPEQKS